MRSFLWRRPVIAWALYDWANSAFATTVMAVFFPLLFSGYWSAGAPGNVNIFRLGLTNTIASLLVAVMAPVVGAIADKGGARVRLLALYTVLGIAMTAAMPLVARGDWFTASLLYILASVGFWGGVQFCDSLLLDVAEEPQYDVVSGFGYSLGYLGGGVLFAVNALMAARPAMFGFADAGEAARFSFYTVAAWWLLFSIPLFAWVRERRLAPPLPPRQAVSAGFAELRAMLRHVLHDRTLLFFLLAYWFYIDGVNTVMKMAVSYGTDLGFSQQSLITALLVTQFVGFPAALAFGWLGKWLGARTGISIAIAVYAGVTLYAYFMQTEREFFVLAIVIGLVQGGIQSLSRSFYGRLVPPGKAGEFFGFYNMMGKAAAVLGPLLMGVTALVTSARFSIVSLVVLFVVGAVLLWFVGDPRSGPRVSASSPGPAGNSR
jgi:MFS transporter, UMF1 family